MATAYTMQDREGCKGGGKGALIAEELSATLRANNAQYLFQPIKTFSKSKRAHSESDDETWIESGTANTLNAFDTGDVRTSEAVVYALDRASFNQGKNGHGFEISDKGINSPLLAMGPSAVCHEVVAMEAYQHHGYRGNNVVRTRYIVRRLTPLECERLQGFPDNYTNIGEWTDSNGKKRQTSDAARYKALGNSIALPPWKFVLKKICACYERDATMASLFSGIGGFDLIWTQLNGMGSVLWESEIEDFPSAVCRRHFGDEETGEKGDFYEAILGRNKTEDV